MQNTSSPFKKQILFFSFLLIFTSCQKEDRVEKPELQPLNTFIMQVNGRVWQPVQMEKDKCMQMFHGNWSQLTQNGVKKPYYTISAYWNPKYIDSIDAVQSENSFKLQIFNVQKTGTYNLTGSEQESHNSYAVFGLKKPDGTYIRYINKLKKSFFSVEVSELIPNPGTPVAGIKGTFHGTLYNENNPLDSLVFSRGTFTLRKTNWNNFNQCAQ